MLFDQLSANQKLSPNQFSSGKRWIQKRNRRKIKFIIMILIALPFIELKQFSSQQNSLFTQLCSNLDKNHLKHFSNGWKNDKIILMPCYYCVEWELYHFDKKKRFSSAQDENAWRLLNDRKISLLVKFVLFYFFTHSSRWFFIVDEWHYIKHWKLLVEAPEQKPLL